MDDAASRNHSMNSASAIPSSASVTRGCKSCFASTSALYLRNRERTSRALSRRPQRLCGKPAANLGNLALHPCVDAARPIRSFQFDHLRTNAWTLPICRSFSWPTILAEIAKCEVRCANCHTRRTARDRGIYLRKHMVLHTTHLPELEVLHNCHARAVSSMDRASTF